MERAEQGASRPDRGPVEHASGPDAPGPAGSLGRGPGGADVGTGGAAERGVDARGDHRAEALATADVDAGPDPTQPVAVDTARIVLAGLACWAVALVVVLAVPALHTGERDWWPWTCVAGLVLGLLGLAYVRRGRGNAAGARRR